MTGNRDTFSSVEFNAWAKRAGLEPAEAFVLQTYLDPALRTIEAGTGGGRIVHALRAMGFRELAGFDYVEGMVREARRSTFESGEYARFSVQDASRLALDDGCFDQIIYLQQIICFLESEELRQQAMREACRILRSGGTALFSFLCHEERFHRPAYALFRWYLAALRTMCGSRRPRQSFPWLRLGGRLNWSAIVDRPPHVYWFRVEEAVSCLHDAGLTLRAIGTQRQIANGQICMSAGELLREKLSGHLYCVCTK